MKNIFIGGVSRSGKSTVSLFLSDKLNYNHIPLDYFTASLKRNFPQCDIKSSVVINDTSEKLAKLLSTVTNIINDTDEKFIIDSAHIMPRDIIKILDLEKWDIYFFGYPNISKEEKFSLVKKYDKNTDWTNRKSDEELLDIFEKLIEISKKIKKECQEYNIKFIDTSKGFIDVLEKEKNIILNNYR